MDNNQYKALKDIITGLRNNFAFRKVKEAKEFLTKCKDATWNITTASDIKFGESTIMLKKLVKNPKVSQVCSFESSKLDTIKELDDLSGFRLNKLSNDYESLLEIGDEINSNLIAKQLLGDFFKVVANEMSTKLLKSAANLDKISLREVHEGVGGKIFARSSKVYKYGCQTQLLLPICRLARRTLSRKEGAIAQGADFANLTDDFKQNDGKKIEGRVTASLVSLDASVVTCLAVRKKLSHMSLIDRFIERGYVTKEQISEHLRNDKEDFSFYFELNHFCDAILNMRMGIDEARKDSQ